MITWFKRTFLKKHGKPIHKNENDAIFKILMYQIETADGEARIVLVNRIADYLSYNLTAIQPIILKQIKRKLQAFDARTSAWKEA